MGCFVKRTWVEINLDYMKENFNQIKKYVGNEVKIMCVVKADAYGHGVEYASRELEECGADWFAVSNIEEAIQLRKYGINKSILILGYTPVEMVEKLYNFNISQAILSYEYACKIIESCREKRVKIKGHIKLDTGMNRIGFPCQSLDDIEKSSEWIKSIYNSPELKLEGIFTHFAVSDLPNNGKGFTEFQFNNFMSLIHKLENKNVHIELKHCCNSGGIIDYPEMKLDMVRAGVILYGLSPSSDLKGKIDIKPSMELKTVISQIKKIKRGMTISYGRTFTALKDMVVATVPIGYADGYSRNLSNKSEMLVCGKRAHVLGRICMDQLMLDVTDIEGVKEGSEVTVFGCQGNENISVDELAKLIGTINYEIVCLIGKRVPRVYYKSGEIIGECIYI